MYKSARCEVHICLTVNQEDALVLTVCDDMLYDWQVAIEYKFKRFEQANGNLFFIILLLLLPMYCIDFFPIIHSLLSQKVFDLITQIVLKTFYPFPID